MMLRHHGVPAFSGHKPVRPFKLPQPLSYLSFLTVAIVLTLVTLACTLTRPSSQSGSNRLVILTRLPTLTPTPLPTLTPTAISAFSEAAMSAESGAASPALTPISPVPAIPTPAEPAVAVPPLTASTVMPASSGPILTTLVGLNLRAGPGLDYAIIGRLAQGQSAQIIGKNPEGTWWQIVYPPGSGSPAWVSGDTQYSTVSNAEEVLIAQLPPPPPTATPTTAPTVPPTPMPIPTTQSPLPTSVPGASPTQTSAPTGNPTAGPTTTPLPGPPGWAFAGVRLYPDQEEETLLLYGNLINNTGFSQELEAISGDFYDAQNQVISDEDDIYAYWPVYVVPPGGVVPFELTVNEIDSVANFNLNVEGEPSGETPRQDFEFSDVNQWTEDDKYCLEGELRNAGNGLQGYLAIAAVLYDGQDNVVNFGDHTEYGPTQIVGDESLAFEICVTPPNQDVVRYELRAWGQ